MPLAFTVVDFCIVEIFVVVIGFGIFASLCDYFDKRAARRRPTSDHP
jgi:hypothetical protein